MFEMIFNSGSDWVTIYPGNHETLRQIRSRLEDKVGRRWSEYEYVSGPTPKFCDLNHFEAWQKYRSKYAFNPSSHVFAFRRYISQNDRSSHVRDYYNEVQRLSFEKSRRQEAKEKTDSELKTAQKYQKKRRIELAGRSVFNETLTDQEKRELTRYRRQRDGFHAGDIECLGNEAFGFGLLDKDLIFMINEAICAADFSSEYNDYLAY